MLMSYILPLVVLLPFFGAGFVGWSATINRVASAWSAGIITVVCIVLLYFNASIPFSGGVLIQSWSFVPILGLDFAFRLDGLSLLFASIVLFIGVLIVIYARYYLSMGDSMGKFYAYLMLFMGSMLGIVLSENIILMVIFWELTSLSSFLLISYWQHRYEGRSGAKIALVVTGGGGLALIAGALILGNIVGSFNLSVILQSGEIIRSSSMYSLMLIMILLGVFTKSAQFPFHFWLPHAMAAPTPVSAYLHSATMVKAGIFLLIRLFPVLSGTPEWITIISSIGMTTLLLGAYTAFFKHDLKGLLAYSTVSHLGLITLLLGFSTHLAVVAAIFHIINHATFKASLFMVTGIVDHEAGTRDMRRLNGLIKYMPHTAILAIIGACAMAGVPLLNGFLSKEMFFEQSLEVFEGSYFGLIVPILATVAGIFSVAYSIRFVVDVFFDTKEGDMPRKPHEPTTFMRIPVDFLAAICLIVGIAPVLTVAPFLTVALMGALQGEVPEYSLAIWHGLNTPLFMSVVALVGGAIVYMFKGRLFVWHEAGIGKVDARKIYERIMDYFFAKAQMITTYIDKESLQSMVAWTIGASLVAGAVGFMNFSAPLFGDREFMSSDIITLVAALVIIVAAVLTTLRHRSRLLALVTIGVVGLLVSLGFVKFSAPDLALTQISVEVVTIILLLLALYYLPQSTPREVGKFRLLRDIGLALLSGVGIFILSMAVLSREFDSISYYFIENSLPKGGGANIVNVILVDFRGFDTLGEITVLALAGLGIFALFEGMKLKARKRDENGLAWSQDIYPLIMQTLTRVLLPLMLLVAIFIFLRGHNMPGGGFIAGLITAVALVVQYMSNGISWTSERIRVDMHKIIASGLLIAVLTGVVAMFFGAPFLTSTYTHIHLPLIGEFELASAMGFDLGVFLVVVGTTVMILLQLGRISYFIHHSKGSSKVGAEEVE